MLVVFVLLGLLAGVIVNALATDLAQHRRPALPHCPDCTRTRPWWQWLTLPVLLARRARCPDCDAGIGLRHVLVEIGLAAAFALLWVQVGPSATLVLYLLYTTILAIIVVTDLEHHIIPNALIFPAIALAIAARRV